MIGKIIISFFVLFLMGNISFLFLKEKGGSRYWYELLFYGFLFLLSAYLGFISFDEKEMTIQNRIINLLLGPFFIFLLYALHKLISKKEPSENNYFQYIIVFTVSSFTILSAIILFLIAYLKETNY